MKIGIDARLYNETGVGRYIRSLIRELAIIDKSNQYVLFLLPGTFDKFQLPNKNWSKAKADVRWHTLKEQFLMPILLEKQKLDLIHFPYFNVPIAYNKKFVVTIHDLTILKMATGRATTHSQLFYQIKRLGFKLSLRHAIVNSMKIITVSESIKKEICDFYKVNPEKIDVTYESGEMEKAIISNQKPDNLSEEYLLYVGNAHPHKNLERLILAFHTVKSSFPNLKLVLVGNDDFFYKRLKQDSGNREERKDIIILGPVSNGELPFYYQNARAFVFPSLSEGFGIPGLESMTMGCPVIASDIPTFREIYNDAALFFDPKNTSDMSQKIVSILDNEPLRQKLISKGYERARSFSWRRMTKETLQIYEGVLRMKL